MDYFNEKIQEAYEESILGSKKYESIVDQYLEAMDILEELGQKIDEKWKNDVEIEKTGEHKDKTIAQLKKEIEAGKGKISKEKMGELLFALRAKQGWKKGEGATGL